MKAILYDWGGLNVWLFHVINDIRNPFWDRLMLAGTELGSHGHFTLYLGAAIVIALAVVARHVPSASASADGYAMSWMTVIGVFVVGYFLSGFVIGWLKAGLDFPRPPAALPPGSVHVLGLPEYRHSFPSGHSAFAMLIAASFWPVCSRWWRIAAAVFVTWVGLSRISLGAHFPADVLGGYVISIMIVLGLNRFLVALVKRASAKNGDPSRGPDQAEPADDEQRRQT